MDFSLVLNYYMKGELPQKMKKRYLAKSLTKGLFNYYVGQYFARKYGKQLVDYLSKEFDIDIRRGYAKYYVTEEVRLPDWLPDFMYYLIYFNIGFEYMTVNGIQDMFGILKDSYRQDFYRVSIWPDIRSSALGMHGIFNGSLRSIFVRGEFVELYNIMKHVRGLMDYAKWYINEHVVPYKDDLKSLYENEYSKYVVYFFKYKNWFEETRPSGVPYPDIFNEKGKELWEFANKGNEK